jgi:hypothetical protein
MKNGVMIRHHGRPTGRPFLLQHTCAPRPPVERPPRAIAGAPRPPESPPRPTAAPFHHGRPTRAPRPTKYGRLIRPPAGAPQWPPRPHAAAIGAPSRPMVYRPPRGTTAAPRPPTHAPPRPSTAAPWPPRPPVSSKHGRARLYPIDNKQPLEPIPLIGKALQYCKKRPFRPKLSIPRPPVSPRVFSTFHPIGAPPRPPRASTAACRRSTAAPWRAIPLISRTPTAAPWHHGRPTRAPLWPPRPLSAAPWRAETAAPWPPIARGALSRAFCWAYHTLHGPDGVKRHHRTVRTGVKTVRSMNRGSFLDVENSGELLGLQKNARAFFKNSGSPGEKERASANRSPHDENRRTV